MKIHQLPDGARFIYQGEEYVKTGPMFGSGPGGQKVIPRYAVLQPIDLPPPAPKKSAPMVTRTRVTRALDALMAECRRIVPVEHVPALEQARQRFLQAID